MRRRRVALCKLLLSKPDLLLLDEPTNHLDAESVLWLEQHLAEYKGAILAVTHDRYFLDNVAEWILELDRGRAYPYEGNYSTYLEKKAERIAVQGRKDAKLQKRLQDELAWVRSGAKARQAKSKARLRRYEEMAAEAEKTRKLDFEEIQIPTGPRLGNVVVEVEHLDKGFDGRTLIKDLSFTLPRNGIVGVIGPNGVGKTTLFKTIVGLEQPDSGTVKVGETVKLSYVDQSRAGIDPKKTVWEVVSDGLDYIEVGQNEIPSRAYVSAFGFKGPDQQKPAGVLSGGERNRLNLALTLKEGGNLILLDEPTNDLDVETLSSLENALEKLPRLCSGDLARPLVPRPHLHPHPGVGGRRGQRGQVVLVRGQLRCLRREQGGTTGCRSRASAPGDPPQAHARLIRRGSSEATGETTNVACGPRSRFAHRVGGDIQRRRSVPTVQERRMSVNPGAAGRSVGARAGQNESPGLDDQTLAGLGRAYLETYRGPHADAPAADATITMPVTATARQVVSPNLITAHYRLGRFRPFGDTRVEVYHADDPAGFGPALQIVTDNTAMVMDSVTVLLHRFGVAYTAIMNPVLRVHRARAGELLDIAPVSEAERVP